MSATLQSLAERVRAAAHVQTGFSMGQFGNPWRRTPARLLFKAASLIEEAEAITKAKARP